MSNAASTRNNNANVRAAAAGLMALRNGHNNNANVRAGAASLMTLRNVRPPMVRGLGQRNLLRGMPYRPTNENSAVDGLLALGRQNVTRSYSADASQRRMSWPPMQTRRNKVKQDGGAGERFMNSRYMQQLQNEMRAQRAANAERNAAEAARRKKERERGAGATQLEPLPFNVEAGEGPTSMLNGGYRRARKSVRRRRY